MLVDREAVERDNAALAQRLRLAKLRQAACLEDVDYRTPRGLDRSLIHSLASGRWLQVTNVGNTPHTATSFEKGKVGNWDTGVLEKGQSNTVTFSEPGTYYYICTPHPWMYGQGHRRIVRTRGHSPRLPGGGSRQAHTEQRGGGLRRQLCVIVRYFEQRGVLRADLHMRPRLG